MVEAATASEEELTLTVPGRGDYLIEIRHFVARVANRAGLDDRETAKTVQAVGEACDNIVEHAYHSLHSVPGSERRRIAVRATAEAWRLVVTIRDDSEVSFPVDRVEALDPREYLASGRRRGLGLYMIKSFVDEVAHTFVPGSGNEVRLTKYISGPRAVS